MIDAEDFRDAVIEASIRYGRDGKGAGGLEGFVMMLREKHPKKHAELVAAGILPPETRH